MARIQKGIALVIGAMVLSTAQAQVLTKDCTGCTTTQIKAMASNCSSGYSYVTNFVSQNFYKICFMWDVNDEYRPPRKEKDYLWATPESQYQQEFQAYEAVYLYNGHVEGLTMYVHVQTAADTSASIGGVRVMASNDNGYVNAYDTVISAQDNNRVVGYLMNNNFNVDDIQSWNPPFGSALVASISQLENAIKSKDISFQNFNATYIVQFPDGSQRTYQYDPSSHTFVAVPGTAYDAHRNKIPENASMASNGDGIASYDYTGTGPSYDQPNMETLLRNLGAQGIPVVNGGSGGSIECSWNGSTNTLSCTVKQF